MNMKDFSRRTYEHCCPVATLQHYLLQAVIMPCEVLTLQPDALVFDVSREPNNLLTGLVVQLTLFLISHLLLINASLQLPPL